MASLARLLVALALLGVLSPLRAAEDETPVSERAVKAAFLYKFPAFIEWPATVPATPDEPLVIGIFGADDVATELMQIAEARKTGRPLIVRRVREGGSLNATHMLFIGARERTRAESFMRAAQLANVLTVTEWEGGLKSGSVVNFVVSEGRVRFEVSLEAAEKCGLKLSSRLLSVALHIYPVRH